MVFLQKVYKSAFLVRFRVSSVPGGAPSLVVVEIYKLS